MVDKFACHLFRCIVPASSLVRCSSPEEEEEADADLSLNPPLLRPKPVDAGAAATGTRLPAAAVHRRRR
jgi:hypothetical protein